MSESGLSVSGIAPRSNGSAAGDRFIGTWNRIVLEARAREVGRRAALRQVSVTKVIPNDGWVTRVDGVPTRIPTRHPYGEYGSLAPGERVAIGGIGDERAEMIDLYRVVRVDEGNLFNRADIVWDRAVRLT